MSPGIQNTAALAGRILLALIFVLSGLSKIPGFEGTAAAIASKGLPASTVLAALTVLVELVGGVFVVIGFATRPSALALALFCLVAGFFFHDFWSYSEPQRAGQYANFMKNLSIAGGALLLTAFGPGAWSIDARRR